MEEKTSCDAKHAKYLSIKLFLSIVGFFVVVIGWQFTIINRLEDKVEKAISTNSKVEAQLAQIQTDLQWIKQCLSGK